MSTRIQNNRLLIETVLLKLGKVEAQLELNTIHQQIMRKPEATCTENSRPYNGRSIGKTNNKELLIEVTFPEHIGLGKNIQKITSPPNINKNDVMMSNPSNDIKVNQDTTKNPLEMPDNLNKQGNEKIRNKDGNNQEYGPINHPIANCEIKIKRTVDLPENNIEQTNEKTTFKVNDNESN